MSEVCPPPPSKLPAPQSGEVVEVSGRVTRIYKRRGKHPVTWGELRHDGPLATARFDPHPPPFASSRVEGVMYLTTKSQTQGKRVVSGLETALAEVFQDDRVVDRERDEPWCVIWTPRRALRLLDLDSHWTTRAGGNGALTSGPRDISRQWAAAIYSQLPDLDGVTWRSSVLGAGRAIAAFERVKDALPNLPDLNRALADPALLPQISGSADRIGYLIVP